MQMHHNLDTIVSEGKYRSRPWLTPFSGSAGDEDLASAGAHAHRLVAVPMRVRGGHKLGVLMQVTAVVMRM